LEERKRRNRRKRRSGRRKRRTKWKTGRGEIGEREGGRK
jgi:hypothetical protein